MQVSVETTTGLERKVTVGIPADVVDQEVEKRLKEAAKTVRINGFRKGKVPMKVVKSRFGAGVRQEVLGDTINRSFYEAVQKESLRPAGQPQIDAKQLEEGKDVEFVATFEVYPEVTVDGLGESEIVRYNAEIGDEDVDNMIEVLRKSQAEWSDVKRKSKKTDRVNIDFVGTKDGEEFAGGSAKGHNLVLGSDSMIPGFEKGIIGMKAGEEKVLELTFPEDYHAEDLKGAAVEFKITVNAVSAQKLPELNEEFFKKYGVEGDEASFREDVKENMEREKLKAIKAKTKEQVMNALLKANEVDIPKALISQEINAMRNQMIQQYGQAAQNLDIQSLLPDDMFKEQAERRTALGLLVSEIVSKEKLVADKDKVKTLIEEAASSYEDPESVVNYYFSNEQLLASVEAAALEDQVVDFLLEKAKVVDKTVSYDEVIKPLEKEEA
ncbi:trigger factor [Teredinibacter sp. KSP-S5-2]|uniref:trigger factor n=1 Tax=Teredinibacter sp. KSP-S5-2 TaxID=3034506 RepID=UPI0029345460|nr:trigger factor [Teredinibacter sp. KSP-S5-2]WNO10907.1 trigger factor [Teredinibacter sp. KSP-S5-2]